MSKIGTNARLSRQSELYWKGCGRPCSFLFRTHVFWLLQDNGRDIVNRQREAEEHDAWFREQVRTGLGSADARKLKSNEDAEARFAARRAEARRRLDRLS